MKRKHSILIGKTVKKIASLRGGGSALPGLVIEKLDQNFLKHSLEQLPRGVVLISGTNGKTTTTKIVSQLLADSGLKVFTNKTGSNFTRGIVAALLGAVDRHGKLDYDIAVLELDEAYAAHFVKQVAPRYSLLLNVMRDQLDRFGEIDHTARLLKTVAQHTSIGVVLNRDDPRVAGIAEHLAPDLTVRYFKAAQSLRHVFVNDDDLYAPQDQTLTAQALPLGSGDVELTGFNQNKAVFCFDNQKYQATMQLSGAYNYLNAAGALALVKLILGQQLTGRQLVDKIEKIQAAFGRGEVFQVNGKPLELILVKNPSGFRLALSSFNPENTDIMIAINDHYADGRDMSWLWDVDFSGLRAGGVQLVSGIRAYDMALRLQYDDVPVGHVNPEIKTALSQFVSRHHNRPRRIFCTYTAMLALRRELKKFTAVEVIS